MFYSNGDGTFRAGATFNPGGTIGSFTVADVNGDGLPDLINNNANPVILIQNVGSTATLQPVDLQTQNSARQALTTLKQADTRLQSSVAYIGSVQSRLQSALSLENNLAITYRAAADRIESADIAFEAASLVKTQILQKAAAAVLSQANLSPQLALKLLGD